MIEIKLKDGQNGYGVVAEYIYRYWKQFGVSFFGEDWEALI